MYYAWVPSLTSSGLWVRGGVEDGVHESPYRVGVQVSLRGEERLDILEVRHRRVARELVHERSLGEQLVAVDPPQVP